MSNYSLLTNKNGIKWDISANNVDLISLNGNGTSGQVLSSNGPNVAPSWTTISAGSNASTINITDTSTNSIYYPTFVSSAGSTQTLRVDTQYLQYNPSTNVFQNPKFLVSNGTETDTTGGLFITTGGVGSKTISSVVNVGATNNNLIIRTTNSGNANSGIYELRQSGTGSGNGVAPLTLPLWSLSSSFFTPTSPVGTPYSTGNYYMSGSVCNMATQLTPSGGENGIVAGFQTSIGDNNGYADMYYNTDQYSATNPYILRLNSAGLLAYGIGTAGTYAFGSQNPSTLATTLFSVDNSGKIIVNATSGSPTITGQTTGTNVPILFDSGYLQNIYGVVITTTPYQMINQQLYATTIFSGNGSFTVKLPSTSSLSTGAWISISFAPNSTTARTLTIQNFSAGLLTTLVSGTTAYPAGTSTTCVRLTFAPNGNWYCF
jgi:hypothetical protein